VNATFPHSRVSRINEAPPSRRGHSPAPQNRNGHKFFARSFCQCSSSGAFLDSYPRRATGYFLAVADLIAETPTQSLAAALLKIKRLSCWKDAHRVDDEALARDIVAVIEWEIAWQAVKA
jgi:hypothetical protein